MSPKGKMFILKRNCIKQAYNFVQPGGRKETIDYGKITARIQNQCTGLDMDYVDPLAVTVRIICGLHSGITAIELDNLAAETAVSMMLVHQDYAILASRLAISSLHKGTKESFSKVMSDLYSTVDPSTNKKVPLISDRYHRIIQKHASKFSSAINHSRDFDYDYFGIKALERNYLLKVNGKVVERPQHMFMRVAVGIHGDDVKKVIETYNLTSERYFSHASPTLRTACTVKPQLSSSFLLSMTDDSIGGLCGTLAKCGLISKYSGTVGLNVHCIRAKGTSIDHMEEAKGIIPMLRCFNQMMSYADQGGNGQTETLATYLEPWHADVFDFLNLRKDRNVETNNLYPALWICDLFMERVDKDEAWSLMCPCESPGLAEVWGKQFEELYIRFEREGRYKRQVPARELWSAILAAQIETGTPHVLYKDHCNKKSNQKHIGTLNNGNLSTEVVQYSSSSEVGACSVASIFVNKFVDVAKKSFDFEKLRSIAQILTRNLDRAIEVNYYPTPEAERSSQRHRPIGIGIQGLADTFQLMRYPFDSEEAQKLNIQIFETLYYATLDASTELADAMGSYSSYDGSPVSEGILQYEMWGTKPTDLWDWAKLKEKIANNGLRNSLLIAVAPPFSTAQMMGNDSSIEPYTSNIYTHPITSGEFYTVNPHLIKDLNDRNLWDDEMENEIIAGNGSIKSIDRIPEDLKNLYKTVWEISPATLLKMAADRAPFIDQSQSTNIYMAEPSTEELASLHFKAWRMGLKTGMYHLHTKSSMKSRPRNEEEPSPKRTKTEDSS